MLFFRKKKCPRCGGQNIKIFNPTMLKKSQVKIFTDMNLGLNVCRNCGYSWKG